MPYYIACESQTQRLYLVRANDTEDARLKLGDLEGGDGDDFDLVEVTLPEGQDVQEIIDLLE